MVDPRLNSVHLEMPRRQEFRRARQAIIGARGYQTMSAEAHEYHNHPLTLLDDTGREVPGQVQVWLVDGAEVLPLRVGLNTVGRSPDNDIVLQDGYISRRHCTFLVHADYRVDVFDTASKNGILVNGTRITGSRRLDPGDELKLCEKVLVFMSRAHAAEGPNTATHAD